MCSQKQIQLKILQHCPNSNSVNWWGKLNIIKKKKTKPKKKKKKKKRKEKKES